MTEKRLFIKGDDMYSNRILDESATFKKARNFNINLPKEREFKTGEGICTDRDDTAYSIDELVNLLNYFHNCTTDNKEVMELKEENELLKEALREELQDNGNAYYIEIFDKLFNLNYSEWNEKELYREEVDWEKLLNAKRGIKDE